jgi:nucleoside-diphosphate-sugar epimerase
MHTILGAGGAVANALTRELSSNNETVVQVSRTPIVNGEKNVTWQRADLLNYSSVLEASKGSTVIYLCAGLPYDKRIWAEQWPVIMQNVINVAKETQARLIFFDNVYAYGRVNGRMQEITPYHPTSKKGEIRAGIANKLIGQTKLGNIKASIARGADFYGVGNMKAILDFMVLDKFAKQEKAQWIGDLKRLHSFSYVPDMGRGLYLLGQDPKSDNQVWHLPTAPPLTGHEFVEMAARIFSAEPKVFALKKFMLQIYGLFNRPVNEMAEMYYQYDNDYIFDSSKFEKAFNVKPTSYEKGIKTVFETVYKSASQ